MNETDRLSGTSLAGAVPQESEYAPEFRLLRNTLSHVDAPDWFLIIRSLEYYARERAACRSARKWRRCATNILQLGRPFYTSPSK